MPLIGIGILAQGLADFGIMLFNRRIRSKEWEMAISSTYHQHTILIGLGHLGFRVAEQLHAFRQKVVVIEIDPKDELIAATQEMGRQARRRAEREFSAPREMAAVEPVYDYVLRTRL